MTSLRRGGTLLPSEVSLASQAMELAVVALVALASHRSKPWAEIAASLWMVRTVSRGYCLQFVVVPPCIPSVVYSPARAKSARVLRKEISIHPFSVLACPPLGCSGLLEVTSPEGVIPKGSIKLG